MEGAIQVVPCAPCALEGYSSVIGKRGCYTRVTPDFFLCHQTKNDSNKNEDHRRFRSASPAGFHR
ncbi:hypothetical protein HanIR_Chr10g0456071 [Helianthus annuus]|nr:hypothetical protein HanIR_Chr10g0456071 [Helianthus annuus]